MAAMDHELIAVGAPALIAVANQAQVARVGRDRKFNHHSLHEMFETHQSQ
jgi:hypothetical protein